jgi:hypothetical protein
LRIGVDAWRSTGDKKSKKREDPTVKPDVNPGSDMVKIATLVGVVALIVISFSNWREIDGIQTSLDNRLGQIDNRIGQISAKVESGAARPAAQPARRGPDPNRVYQIKTAAAPIKGPVAAPITIAEFSDFQ